MGPVDPPYTFAFKCQSGYRISILEKYLPLNRFRAAAFDGFSEFFRNTLVCKMLWGVFVEHHHRHRVSLGDAVRRSMLHRSLFSIGVLLLLRSPRSFVRTANQHNTPHKNATAKEHVNAHRWYSSIGVVVSYGIYAIHIDVCEIKRGSENFFFFSIGIDNDARETKQQLQQKRVLNVAAVTMFNVTCDTNQISLTEWWSSLVTHRSRSRISHQSFVSEPKREKKKHVWYIIQLTLEKTEMLGSVIAWANTKTDALSKDIA